VQNGSRRFDTVRHSSTRYNTGPTVVPNWLKTGSPNRL